MQWFYARNNEQLGPIMEEEFRELVSRGIVTPDTLVWNETMTDWQPYAAVMHAGVVSAASSAPVYPSGKVQCVQCKNYFAEEDTVAYQNVHVCAACKPFFFQSLREGGNVPGQLRYAGFWIRFVAKFVDFLLMGIVLIVIMFMFFFREFIDVAPEEDLGRYFALQGAWTLLTYSILIGYNSFFIARFAATPGKMVCGLKVVRADSSDVTTGRAVGRAFADILSYTFCYIGYIIAAFDDQKRALHDYMCDTRVVYK